MFLKEILRIKKSKAVNPTMVILHAAPAIIRDYAGPVISVPSLIAAQNDFNKTTRAALLVTKGKAILPGEYDFPVFNCETTPHYREIENLPAPFCKPEIVVFHSTYIYRQASIAIDLQKKKIPYIITPRGGMTKGAQKKKPFKKHMGNILFFNRMVKHAIAIHCLTAEEEKDVRRWGVPTFIAPNGFNLPSDAGNHNKVENTGPLRLLFIGRIDIMHKGLDILLEGFAAARKKLPGSMLALRLAGPDHEGDLEKLRSLAQRLDISDSIDLTGPVVGKQKHALLLSTDIFVHPSRFEGQPMAVLEALAYGVPCLLTPGTNMAEEVKRAGAGWSVEGTAEAIAEGLKHAYNQKENLPRMSRNARSLVESKYNWKLIAEKTLKEYEKLRGL